MQVVLVTPTDIPCLLTVIGKTEQTETMQKEHLKIFLAIVVSFFWKETEGHCVSAPSTCVRVFCPENQGKLEEILVTLTNLEERFCAFYWEFRVDDWSQQRLNTEEQTFIRQSASKLKYVSLQIRNHLG